MNEPFITINDKKVELEKGDYAKRNAELILLAGHVFHSLENREVSTWSGEISRV